MSALILASIGGFVSFISTSLGSALAPIFGKFKSLRKYHMSMDFALGVMLSAAAFSLVGPELVKGDHLSLVFSGLFLGMLFIYLTHKMIAKLDHKLLLISALIFHNLPEGLGAGASLAGMTLNQAIPLQVALSVQNIAEGLLLTLLLKSMGLSLSRAVLGGVFSGLIEFGGAVTAGFFMQETLTLLPFFLSLAGGAMTMSVGLEFKESFDLGKKLSPQQFAGGLMVIPLTNFLLG
jgi:ZIP family zinc transporter